ncbi:MAG: hypothetical protein ACLR78_01550 [Roseburia sp.]
MSEELAQEVDFFSVKKAQTIRHSEMRSAIDRRIKRVDNIYDSLIILAILEMLKMIVEHGA